MEIIYFVARNFLDFINLHNYVIIRIKKIKKRKNGLKRKENKVCIFDLS